MLRGAPMKATSRAARGKAAAASIRRAAVALFFMASILTAFTPTSWGAGQAIVVGGKCSLYLAIQASNGDSSAASACGGTNVLFTQNIFLNGDTVPLSQPVGITGPLTIQSHGSCVVISQAAYLTVNPGTSLTLLGVGMSADGSQHRSMIDNKAGTLTIKGLNGPCLFSNNKTSNLPETGGVLFNYDNGETTIDGATFDSSHARAEGGAIYLQSGRLNITSNSGFATTISSDSSDRGGAIWIDPSAALNIASSNFKIVNNKAGSAGGAIYNNHGTVTIARGNGSLLNVSIQGNTSRSGGGLFIAGGKFSMTGAVIYKNSASQNGGGVYIDDVNPGTITQTYFRENSADRGAAIFNRHGQLSIQTTTFSDDRASNSDTIVNDDSSTLNVLNSTLDGDLERPREGIVVNGGSTAAISFSTMIGAELVNNTTDVHGLTEQNSIIFAGFCVAIFDGLGNLQAATSFCPGTEGNPEIINLAKNGGPTPTNAIFEAASPAVGAIKYGNCRVGQTVITTDQRGATRPSAAGGACTTGAFEYNATNVPPDAVPPGVPVP